MTLAGLLNNRLAARSTYYRVLRTTTHMSPTTASFHAVPKRSMEQPSELFDYTSGRWLWNDALRQLERRRQFNVSGLKQLAASAVGRSAEEVAGFEKLGEGGFNRTFLITMHDGFQLVGRIPYASTEPKHLVIASEVATIDFLRMHDIPVPQIYAYSTTPENPAGTEYMFMELVRGTKLGDIWSDLPEKARIKVVSQVVQLESKLFALRFPASGSLYYTKDLDVNVNKAEILTTSNSSESTFSVGPDTRLSLWHGRRSSLQLDRGPFSDPAAVLAAGAKKEIAHLARFGQPLHPFHRLRREVYDYQKVSPSGHLHNLEEYLQAVPHIIPTNDTTLHRPTLRHPDLNPNNVFVSADFSITGLIDWQHCALLPLFLQCGIPDTFQNYGDTISETLTTPKLPQNFDKLSEKEQFEQVMLLRRRQLHFFYVVATLQYNQIHYNALTQGRSALRQKLFHHSGAPWDGDNVTFKADLVELAQQWPSIIAQNTSTNDVATHPCPFAFSEEEAEECLRLHTEQIEADKQLQACRDIIGIGPEGWVPLDQYEETRQRERKLKAAALEIAESEEERQRLHEHWIFDDFDEAEYF